jgi:Domain of unknown function (DUF1883)
MDFVHYPLGHQPQGAVVEVSIDTRAFVRLVDEANFQSYRRGDPYEFVGGEAIRTLVPLAVPRAGSWHLVIDFAGGFGNVRSSVNVKRLAA